jgi:hypothetical protein
MDSYYCKKNNSLETKILLFKKHISYQENFNLPTGGGKKGLVFGSFLAGPTAMTMALSLGQI